MRYGWVCSLFCWCKIYRLPLHCSQKACTANETAEHGHRSAQIHVRYLLFNLYIVLWTSTGYWVKQPHKEGEGCFMKPAGTTVRHLEFWPLMIDRGGNIPLTVYCICLIRSELHESLVGLRWMYYSSWSKIIPLGFHKKGRQPHHEIWGFFGGDPKTTNPVAAGSPCGPVRKGRSRRHGANSSRNFAQKRSCRWWWHIWTHPNGQFKYKTVVYRHIRQAILASLVARSKQKYTLYFVINHHDLLILT